MTHKWEDMEFSIFGEEPDCTGYDPYTLMRIAESTVKLPSDFKVHPRLERQHIANRVSQLEENKVDWATAEAMALGSLAIEGHNVRLVGQDSERGTFSQRHAIFTEQETQQKYFAMKESQYMKANRVGRLDVINSNLSELGVTGYEYGYSLENPKNLCIWEA